MNAAERRDDRPRRGPDAGVRPGNPVSIHAVAVGVGLVLFLYFIHQILLPFVVAGIVGYVAAPLVDRLAARTRLPRALFAMLVFLAVLGVGALLGFLGIPPLIEEVRKITGDLHGTVEGLARTLLGDGEVEILGQQTSAAQLADQATQAAGNWVQDVPALMQVLLYVFGGTFGLILTIVLMAYFLLGAPAIGRGLYRLLPPSSRPETRRVWARLDPVLRRYFVGVAIVVAYASVVAYVGLGLVLGIRHAASLALATGLLEMVPVIGPASSAALAGLVAVHYAAGFWDLVAYAIYATVLRLSIDQFVGPIVLGKAARVHPVLVIFCFLSGGVLFGVVGVILALPVAVTVKVILATLYEERLHGEAPVRPGPSD